MEDALSLAAVAALTDESLAELRRWQALGLLAAGDDEMPSSTAQRVRLVQLARRRGIDPEDVARVCDERGDLLGTYVDQLMVGGGVEVLESDATADASGLTPAFLDRMALAAGLRDQPGVYGEDIAALQSIATALDFGFPEEAMVQLVRVFSSSLARAADAANRLFHFYVHERLRGEGLSGAELTEATTSLADPLTGLLEPAVLYFFRKGWDRAVREDFIVHLREEAAPPPATPGEVERSIVFVDLSRFTPMTEAMGDAAAAEVLDRFSDLVREVAAAHEGEIVKQIGDAFMLVFSDATRAVRAALELEDRASVQPRFPAVRIGAHSGPVLYREGDYVGANVNLAARIAAEARPHQVLVTATARDQARLIDVEFRSLGAITLKGITDAIEVFEADTGKPRRDQVIDPVCGMQLEEATTDAELQWEGERLSFCSARCLRRFLDDPAGYATARR